MKLHSNAALTQKQRQEIQKLYATGQFTHHELATRFATTRKTIGKWCRRNQTLDTSSAPKQPHCRVTPAYRQAVLDYRQANPTHGPVRIEVELRAKYGPYAPSTVGLLLKQADLNRPPRPKPTKAPGLPVGRHRTQMDVQQLPAIEGQSGFDGAARAVQDFDHSSVHSD